MKTILVSTYTHPIALGLRYVSSYLKAAGHDVEMILMSSKRATARADFSEPALEAFVERIRDADLIGMSLMTNTFHRARVLTQRIRDAGIKTPIIWGGTHPTVAPVESLEIPDMICVGEGEEPMLQLAERLQAGKDPTDIGSLGFRAGGPFGNRTTVRNAVQNLELELDDYPFPDYELETHWVAAKDGLVQAHPDNLRGTLHRLRIETTRGCPYPCTFCNNAALIKIYRGKGAWVRKRSADNVIAEIRQAQRCFPTLEAVNIVDDLFFVRSEDEIEDFAVKYKAQVNLPFELDAFPNTITDAKVRSLTRVPISLISMGIQSGSQDTLKNIYNRPTPIEKIIAGIDIFKRYRIRAEYHYIISNPYEPDKNVIETMRFIASHHKGRAILRVFPLMFYPGTPLYDRARADGLIGEQDKNAYEYMYTGSLQFAKHDYLGAWLRTVLHLRNVGLPRWATHRLIDLVTHRWTRKCIDRKWFPKTAFIIFQISRKLMRNFIYQPFIRPFRYLRRKPRYEELHPEDEVTLPRANMAEEHSASDRSRSAPSPPPTARWRVSDTNIHAVRKRTKNAASSTVEAAGLPPSDAQESPVLSGHSANQPHSSAPTAVDA